jgi:hypothetical protein
MGTQTLHLNDATSLGVAEFSRATQTGPAWLRFAKGRRPVDAGEVVVVVLSSNGGVVRRASTHGRELDHHELLRWLVSAEAAVRGASDPPPDAPQLTAGEAALLDSAGLPEGEPGASNALERSGIEYELLLADSVTLEQAAKMLHVKTTSRLRQRLRPADRTLYGIKVGRSWRLPKFQFARGKLVRGIDQVFPHVRGDAHPLAVKAWFSTPHQDLVLGENEQRVTPLAWLTAGHPPDEVARLATEI